MGLAKNDNGTQYCTLSNKDLGTVDVPKICAHYFNVEILQIGLMFPQLVKPLVNLHLESLNLLKYIAVRVT